MNVDDRLSPRAAKGDPSQSPTLTAAATQMGVIMGTAAYMSPEQARGKTVDKRTDIWAFGCVLLEMLTARRLFDGEDVSEVLAKVIRDDIRLDGIPHQCRRLLERCLVKDPKRRLRDVGDAWYLLGSEHLAAADSTGSSPARWLGWGVAAVLAIGYVVGDLFLQPQSTRAAPESRRFAFDGPDGAPADALSVSPDGRHIAFVAANSDGEEQVWVRSLSTLEARPLPGTERARRSAVIWSPNSRYIAFESQRRLQRVGLDGTPPLPIAELVRPPASGSWGDRGVIVVGSGEGILQIPEDGGNPVRVTGGPDSVTEAHIAPWFLPDGRHFLYLRHSDNPAEQGIWVARIDTAPEEQPSERLLAAESAPVFAPSLDGSSQGHLLFERDGVLVAQAFDADALALGSEVTPLQAGITPGDEVFVGLRYSVSETGLLVFRQGDTPAGDARLIWYDRHGTAGEQFGPPDGYRDISITSDDTGVMVWVGVNVGGGRAMLGEFERNFDSGAAQLTISASGSLAWVPGGIQPDVRRSLVWVDRQGEIEPLAAEAGSYWMPRLSPDEERIAVYTRGLDGGVLVHDRVRGISQRLTVEGQENTWPVWVLGGSRIVFRSMREGAAGLFWKPFDDSEPAQRLTRTELARGFSGQAPSSWSEDAGVLAVVDAGDIKVLSLDGERQEPEPFLESAFRESHPVFSPDGRWLAYVSDESGESEVYVTPYPGPGATMKISQDGGVAPAWAGGEIFYRSENRLMAVEVRTDPDLELGIPLVLFLRPGSHRSVGRNYDVTADGERFLMIEADEEEEPPIRHINVVLNWSQELLERVPAN